MSILTVQELSTALKFTVEETFAYVTVEGEISKLATPASGHVYFTLKDQATQAIISSVIWKGAAARMRPLLQEGALIHATGKVTTYAPRSNYQLDISSIQPAGQGALLQMLAERKAKLMAEGVFDETKKRPLPYLPQHIGIITSPTGAVIQDMLHRIAARCPRKVTVWPSLVQGEGAAEQLLAALNGFQNLPEKQRPDILILARGGGSLEDLMAFNDEHLTRAVANCKIPIVSAVGHEPDVSLTDHAADLRAPTPTAAAELVLPVRADLLYTLQNMHESITRTFQNQLREKQQFIDILAHKLPNLRAKIENTQKELQNMQQNSTRAMQNQLQKQRVQIEHTAQILQNLSPDAPLKRGYLYAEMADGTPVRSAKTPAKTITLTFHDGKRDADLHPAS